MIPKASQRAGGQQLATHLMNEFDNDSVEIAEVRGAIAGDLHGAFAEWHAISKATQCQKYLYSVSLNPDPQQGPLPRDLYFKFVDRVEKTFGLGEQPRAVVFHVKHGREHCHVVWSRIDGDRLRAVHLSHDHQKLRTITREFAREHGLRLPPGLQQDNRLERFNDRARGENLAEQQQQERTGITKAERMRAVSAAWKEGGTPLQFVAALEQRGYLLARGDRRAYVVVDRGGEIHSLSRQLAGVPAKEVKARLGSLPLDKLPDAHKAQAFIRKGRETRAAGQPEPARAADSPAMRRQALADAQGVRRAALAGRENALSKQHQAERAALKEAQSVEVQGVGAARLAAQPQGMLAFLTRITGIQYLVDARHRRQDASRAAEHKRQDEALARRHHRETLDFRRHAVALRGVEKRERRSLETAIRREALAVARGGTAARQPATPARSVSAARSPDAGRLSVTFNAPPKDPAKPRDRELDRPAADPSLSTAFGPAVKGDRVEELRRALQRETEARSRRPRAPGEDRER